MTGVPSGQGTARGCRMGSGSRTCVSPGPSDMALPAPSWAECSHRHVNLGSPARGLQLALPSVGRETDQPDPQDGGGPLLCLMCSLWKGIETRQHGERKKNDPPPGLPGILPGARTIRQLLPCPRPRPEPENSPGGCRLGRGPRKPGRDMPSQHRPRGRAAGGPCPCPDSRWGWALWLPKDARSHFPRKFCKGLGNVRLFLF